MATIPHVIDDQLIETPWGNAVADAINANTAAIAAATAFKPVNVVIVAAQTAISGIADIIGLTIPAMLLPVGRRYKVSLQIGLFANGAGVASVYLTDLTNGVYTSITFNMGASEFATFSGFITLGGSANQQGFKVRASTSANTVNTNVSNSAPAYLVLEDIGAI